MIQKVATMVPRKSQSNEAKDDEENNNDNSSNSTLTIVFDSDDNENLYVKVDDSETQIHLDRNRILAYMKWPMLIL